MLRLVNPNRFLASENVSDFMNTFPIICSENAAVIAADECFIKQLLIETALLTDDSVVHERIEALQEGAVATIVDSITGFIKSLLDFFKKLVERLTTSFAANADSIDKWMEKVKDRLAANKNNAPKFEYEGYKWNPVRLEKFRVDIEQQLPVPVAAFTAKLKEEADNFNKAMSTKVAEQKGKLLDKQKANAQKEEIDDSELKRKDKKQAVKEIDKQLDNDKSSLKDADKLINQLDNQSQEVQKVADKEKVTDIKGETEKNRTEDFMLDRAALCDELLGNEDENKGMDEVRKEVFGGTEKVTIKGFTNVSLDGMMNVIKNYKKTSDKFTQMYNQLIDEYNKVEATLNNINFDNSKVSKDVKDKTTNYADVRRGRLNAYLGQLRWAQGLLNTCAKNAMSWHKEMVNDFMKTITTFAMTNFN